DAAAAGWASVDRARLAFDAENRILHAVWQRSGLPGQTQSEEIYYASSHDDGKTWSSPLKVADGTVTWPQVIVPVAGQVYLAWCQTDAGTSNVYGQFSLDGGQRWSPPASINQFDHAACPVSLATDGLGQMHLASTAANTGDESILLTAAWNGQAWSQPESYALGQRANSNNAAASVLVPQADRLSALIKLWSQQSQAGSGFDIVATDRQIPVVGVMQPAPTFTPMPTATATPTATPAPTEIPKLQPNDRGLKPPTSGGGPPPLVLGGALAGVIVVIVVARIIWLKRR
ncbi:MAG TPA: sialidase family protein, partial [Anaerolineae bacterium]|nr:sialidase family protein [Anaerolineae bacterium]